MRRYLLGRLAQLVLVLFGVTLGTFSLLHLVPGDPARTLLGVHATDREVAVLRHEWGLDRPVISQYGSYLGRVLHLNLGSSTQYQTPVATLIGHALPVTLAMIAVGVVFAVLLAVPLAIIAAHRQGGVVDQLVRAIPLVGLGMPPFWIGFVLLLLFALKWKLFPSGGYGFTLTEHVSSLILPGVTIAIAMAPILVRSLRAALIDIFESDYITAADGKGLGPVRVLVRHGLRNAAIPGVSVLAVNLGLLLGGTVVIESVYGLPGVGNLLLNAIFNRDFDVVQSVALVYAIIVVVINLAADIGYAALDPRVVLAP